MTTQEQAAKFREYIERFARDCEAIPEDQRDRLLTVLDARMAWTLATGTADPRSSTEVLQLLAETAPTLGDLQSRVLETLGAASVCWDANGVFMAEQAIALAEELLAYIATQYRPIPVAPVTDDANWHRGDWMQTYTGKKFFPMAPDASAIDIVDIAHALSMQCRYNGHTTRFYSVAEHCVYVSIAVERAGGSTEDQLWGLLHDAGEAYVGDMVRPLKVHMPAFRDVEDVILSVIAQRFNLPAEIPASVHEADTRMLLDEKMALLAHTGEPWSQETTHTPLGIFIQGLSPELAERDYLERFRDLMDAMLSAHNKVTS